MTEKAFRASVAVVEDDDDDFFFTSRLLQSVDPSQAILRFYYATALIDYLSFLPEPLPNQLPELIFLDLKMPGSNGFEFLEWFYQHKRFANITVIVLSGSGEPEDIARARKLGASHYLIKNPTIAKLANILQKRRNVRSVA